MTLAEFAKAAVTVVTTMVTIGGAAGLLLPRARRKAAIDDLRLEVELCERTAKLAEKPGMVCEEMVQALVATTLPDSQREVWGARVLVWVYAVVMLVTGALAVRRFLEQDTLAAISWTAASSIALLFVCVFWERSLRTTKAAREKAEKRRTKRATELRRALNVSSPSAEVRSPTKSGAKVTLDQDDSG